MPEEGVRRKGGFDVALFIVVLVLVGYAFRHQIFPEAKTDGKGGKISAKELAKAGGAGGGAEADDKNIPTTTKEYKFVPAETLPPVKGVSSYEKMTDRTVKFALNVWAGWAPIILQNQGQAVGKVWKTWRPGLQG